MVFFPFFRVHGIHSRRRTILSLNTKTSLGGYEAADDQRYHVISYPNHKTRKKTPTMRKLSVFFCELYLMCMNVYDRDVICAYMRRKTAVPATDPFVLVCLDNPVNFFPVYEPSAERVKAVQDELAEANNPLSSHYDASQEVRAKGAAFYQFSGDEETRKRQMEELRGVRDETKKTREDLGAMDVRPGEVEGMREESGQSTSRALEKRKREIEERRALLEAKRRKTKVTPEGDVNGVTGQSSSSVMFVASDPFVALEKKAVAPTSRTPEISETRTTKGGYSEADAFLAQLEEEILKKR